MKKLIKDLPDLQEKIREIPYSAPYSIKARALIHAQLSRLPLTSQTLEKDKNVIIKKCPFLLNEMVNLASNFAQAVNANYAPKSRFNFLEKNIFIFLFDKFLLTFRFSRSKTRNNREHDEIIPNDCASPVDKEQE